MVTVRFKDYMNDFIRLMMKKVDRFVDRKIADIIYVAQVEDVQYDETLQVNNIKATKLHNKETVENIKVAGVGMGNYSGIIRIPRKEEFGLVIENNDGEPFWIMNVLDAYTNEPDRQPAIRESMIIQNKEGGAYQIFSKNDNVTIITKDGGKVIFLKDGGYKILGKTNHGIAVDENGNMTISANNAGSLSFTSTPINFEVE